MGKVSIYWFIVSLTFLYLIYKNRKSSIKILIVLCFYSGLASFAGKVIENPYKIVLVLLSIYILLKYNALSGFNNRERFLLVIFILFSISFIYSAFINEGYFNLVFSQYGKYFTPICLLYILNRILIKAPFTFLRFKALFFSLLTIQIFLSAVKILTIGLQESTVGSLAYIGGGPATMVPVLGFILVWLDSKGDIKGKDWAYVFLLVFIAFASNKRAIWFIMPIIILLFMYYVPRKVKVSYLLYAAPVIPLIFYVGVRLSPTLNKENRIGGSFDLNYVMDYSQNYYFGKTSGTTDVQLGTGRGGATYLLLRKFFYGQSLSFKDYWGSGLQEVYTTNYEKFNEKKYGVNSKGAVTGIFQSYISSGYVGVMLTILFIISILRLIEEPRIRYTISLLMFWDYLFYSGLILRTQALFILLFFIVLYSNHQIKNSSLQIRPVKN
jgi:hypothetical protein